MPITNDTGSLIGFACEAICWGIHVVLFLASLILLLRHSRTNGINKLIVVSMCALFALCTAHFAIEFNHFYTVLERTGVHGFANETKLLIGADILISLCDLLGEFILLYRCWIVWERNYWVVIFPALTSVAGFACIMEVAHLVVTLNHTAPVAPTALIPLGIAGYTLSLATNVIATALIVSKLWWMFRKVTQESLAGPFRRGAGVRALQSAAAIVVESGLLYLIAQLALVVLFSLQHPAQGIAVYMAVQIYGIAPTLIIIRVALGLTSEHTVHQVSTTVASAWQVNVHASGGSPPMARRLPGPSPHGAASEDTYGVEGRSMEMKEFSTSQVNFIGNAAV